MPEEVRAEIGPFFMNSDPVVDEDDKKLTKLDDNTADIVRTGLTVSRPCMIMTTDCCSGLCFSICLITIICLAA